MKNPYEKFVAPFKELNELTFKSIEQITALQLKAFEDNAKIGLYALDTVNEIKDFESFKTYLESQIAVTQYVSDNVAIDAQEIAEVGKSFATNAKKVVERTIISD